MAHGLASDPPESAAAVRPADLTPLARALWAVRAPLAGCMLAGGMLALLLAWVLPPTYVAQVSVLEAPRAGGSSALDQLGMSAEMLGLRSGGGSGSNALTYPDVLRSRRVLGALLDQRYRGEKGESKLLADWIQPGRPGPQRTERALDELRKRLDIALDRRTNLLRLSVSDRDPVLAAAVANAACAELQRVVMTAMMSQAGANRRFVQQQLDGARRDLARAENALRGFREDNLRFGNAPRLALDQARLMREVRTQEEVVIALTRQFEMAKLDEQRDVPVLNVLDPAVPPAFRSSPQRVAMAWMGLLLGLAVGLALQWPRWSVALASHSPTTHTARLPANEQAA